ncbi:MAG: hypothetical protein KKF41_11135 [Actinobacteria bacterium]|nr:hypothetical protein [Actinomycetota bacterium]MBU1944946.1 hypothetical protein [Actinomycetota bacterium]MBU2688128.1 hypothetical protein [Actinomycetota bacterium]
MRRAGAARVALAILLLGTLLPVMNAGVLAAPPPGAAAPAGAAPSSEAPDIRMAFSKDAYWYAPGSKAVLKVTLANDTRLTLRDVQIRVRVHTPNETRADLDASFDNKLKRSYRMTQTYDRELTLEPGDTTADFELEISSGRFSDGVYPMTVEALQEDATIASAISQLVVMSPDTVSENPQLRLAVIFETAQPSHRNPEGLYKGNELADECDASSASGWLANLTSALEQWEDYHLNLCLSPLLLEELDGMTGGYQMKQGDKTTNVPADSREAADASSVIGSFMRLAQTPAVQSLPAPYASPDLEKLVSFGWKDDASTQMSRGHKVLEQVLDQPLARDYLYPPAGILDDDAIKALGSQAGRFLVLSPTLLDRSREGKRLLRGDTLAQPVLLDGEQGAAERTAIFTDARMEQLAARLANSGDTHGVTQALVSELTNLYLEKPGSRRACVFIWPGRWRPSRGVLEEVLRGLSATPWLLGSTVSECLHTVPAIEDSGLTLPGPGDVEPNDYFREVERARRYLEVFSGLVESENPLPDLMQRDVFISESDVWRQWDRQVEGLSFAGWVVQAVGDELAKIDLPPAGSITLAGRKAEVPLSVVNGTGYPVKAVLEFSSNGLTFPKGSTMKVTLEPKENLFEIPVTVKKKGRVRFSARLQAGNMVLGETDFTVLTSRFNTFAIAVVGGLLALIGAAWGWSLYERGRAGKHKTGNVPGPDLETLET